MYNQGSVRQAGKQEDRSARIERQHSQEMALRYVAIHAAEVDFDQLKEYIDWFENDVSDSIALRKPPTLTLDEAILLVDKIVSLDAPKKAKVASWLKQTTGQPVHSREDLIGAVCTLSVEQGMYLANDVEFDKTIA